MKPALLPKGEGSNTCIHEMSKFILSFPEVFQQIMTNYTGISWCYGNYCCLLIVPWGGYNPCLLKFCITICGYHTICDTNKPPTYFLHHHEGPVQKLPPLSLDFLQLYCETFYLVPQPPLLQRNCHYFAAP